MTLIVRLPPRQTYFQPGWQAKPIKATLLVKIQKQIQTRPSALQLHFIQCPFPIQIQFGLEKLHPKIAYDFPNQFQFGLERKKLILQNAASKPNSDWFGKF